MIRIAIATLGCKANQAESAIILDQFGDFQLVPWQEEADIYIINTCTVTNRTDYKSRYLIRQALSQKAQNPFAKIVVTGCFAQRYPEEIAKMGNIDLLIDNQQKLNIADILAGGNYEFMDIMQAKEFAYKPTTKMYNRTRAFQIIQNGCDFNCAYCAVPYGRGRSRSATLEQVLQQAHLFVESGYKEIVLSGINLGLYKDGNNDLTDVLFRLNEIKGLELIRLSSIEPQLFNDKLINTLPLISKLCPHYHIPLQCGADTGLKRMRRRHSTTTTNKLTIKIWERIPYPAIGMDIITGFPGETEEEHQQTCSYLRSLPLAYLHIFSFSKRKGTPAFELPNQIPKTIKNHRANELTQISRELTVAYTNSLVENNIPLRGIVEKSANGYCEFLSDHYVRVRFSGNYKPGDFVQIPSQDLQIRMKND
ncbi:MAG TPA: tRNA (N(6)-L-threonylcarbamoyladenosine(37)-C(2))-methylthiotransferase MtaB [Candidatus Cloacimonas sp.]|nr:tRNA (N(6)-L-threonylcarbamoyladenosine(37)-C(2))-methylthiotransferase MtaB [Candidatus Cloacimonas sp.]HQO47261.1 tRNA (N(6)-L-threonylcarbamoyladenosine(37)-C(2))-methylthiotransferase MtaB [Candidatus Cloacimonas sp.]